MRPLDTHTARFTLSLINNSPQSVQQTVGNRSQNTSNLTLSPSRSFPTRSVECGNSGQDHYNFAPCGMTALPQSQYPQPPDTAVRLVDLYHTHTPPSHKPRVTRGQTSPPPTTPGLTWLPRPAQDGWCARALGLAEKDSIFCFVSTYFVLISQLQV